jgi:hypothetical protein
MPMPRLSSRMRELLQAYRIACDPRYRDDLAACGLKQGGPIWGFDFVEFSRLIYQPAPGGDCALIVPVFDDGKLIDLVACRPTDYRIATRHGIARALGENWIDLAVLHRARLPLYSDPLRWLMNGRRGAVVLDWSQAGFLFDGLEGITCDSPALANRVHATTRRMSHPPRLHFFTRSRSNAA